MPTAAQIATMINAGNDKDAARVPFVSGKSALSRFMSQLSSDNVFFRDEFLGALDTNFWTTVVAAAHTAGQAFAADGTVGGNVKAITGTNATNANRMVELYGPLNFSGDKNCILEVKFTISDTTNSQFEIGWLDTYTNIATVPAPSVSDIDTPAFATGAGDVAVVAMDQSQTLKTMALCALGSGGLNAGSKANLGTLTPTSATQMTVKVGVIGNTAVAMVNNSDNATAGYFKTLDSAIEGGTTIRPYIYFSNANATSRSMQVDLVTIWMDR